VDPCNLTALLAPVMSRSAIGMGGSVADRQWFCTMLAWIDFCCFNNSFHHLYFDSSSYWVGIMGNDWIVGEGHGGGTLGWVFRAT
jgi:hypothetical protein